jgi:hypothetical protein
MLSSNVAAGAAGAGRTKAAGGAEATVAEATDWETGVCDPGATSAVPATGAAAGVTADLVTGEMFFGADRTRSVLARTDPRAADRVDCSAVSDEADAAAAAGALDAFARVAARRALGPGFELFDVFADVVEAEPPVSESTVSAAATPVPEIRAEPTPTSTALVPSKIRRSPITNRLNFDNEQTLSRTLSMNQQIN